KYTANASNAEEEKTNIAIRVIADHVCAVAFAIADGQLPSNTGAGYVIRRILRRAVRYGFTFLNIKEAFIYQLAETLSEQMGDSFLEIRSQKDLVMNVIREEENSFLRTLDAGILLLDKAIEKEEASISNAWNDPNYSHKSISGDIVFQLYDTFGFPVDLTELILREKGYSFNKVQFDKAMQVQKTRSRAASETATDDWTVLGETRPESFVGYDEVEKEVRIARYRTVDSKKDGKLYQLVFDATPFYPEGGGQVGDRGTLFTPDEAIEIIDTKKENNLILHFTRKLPADPEGKFMALVNTKLRNCSASNHSATHLLHQALRTILGTHVEQKGSLVSPNHLRFDFSHFSKVTDEELQQVENFVNERIQEQLPLVERRNIPFAQAVEEGAMALFGEKYGDTVRAIKFGDSMELCGGIHVKNTAAIWHFKIVSEGAVAAGIRRIEAITNEGARAFYDSQESALKEIKEALKNPPDAAKAVASLQDENARLKKQVEALLKEKAKNLKEELAPQLQEINGVRFLAKQVGLSAEGAKDLAYELGSLGKNLFLVLATAEEGKPMLACYISKELAAERNLNAGQVVRELGKYIQGGGGGQPFFATAGGKNADGIGEALDKVADFLK
ncbi:MAG TPA: alanine--tRNA ligase, partial [Flavobacterium sp.]|nr:alanine--tRNA ligase [Flavobacterium sp.]